jgi:hypothetical protein
MTIQVRNGTHFFACFTLVKIIWFHLINFQIEPELGAEIGPGMAFIPFPSNTLYETRFKPTTLKS